MAPGAQQSTRVGYPPWEQSPEQSTHSPNGEYLLNELFSAISPVPAPPFCNCHRWVTEAVSQYESLNSGLVFDSGEAKIRTDLGAVLESMLQTLVPYAGKYDFAVEGHTDNRPIAPGGTYRSNWELSTDRANAVRSRLETVGIDRGRIRVEGYADTKVLEEDKLKGLSEDERLARHRRVVVRVY